MGAKVPGESTFLILSHKWLLQHERGSGWAGGVKLNDQPFLASWVSNQGLTQGGFLEVVTVGLDIETLGFP